MIKITFLGTSGHIPSADRNHPAMLLTYKGENILIDCGEGTQRQFKKAKISPAKITKILITHWHGDHVLGIPGLLKTLALSDYNKTLYVCGPKGTKELMKALDELFVFNAEFPIKVKEVDEGKFFETENFYLAAEKMAHGVICNAYSFVEKGQLRIDKEKLGKTKLPSSALIQKLKQGKDITYKGKKYLAKNLTYMKNSKKICFVLDTSMNRKIKPFVENSDLLVFEATYTDNLKDLAKRHRHLTAKQAAEIAKKSKSKKLVLTHMSQRYEKNPKVILNEAKKIFKNTTLAKDLDVVRV